MTPKSTPKGIVIMALSIKDYVSVSLEGSKINHLKRNKKDHQKFIFDFTKNKKRYRQTYIAPKDTPTNMIKMAQIKCEAFYDQSGKIKKNININIAVDEYWDLFWNYKKDAWSKRHLENNKRFYTKHIKGIIGQKQVRYTTTADIDTILQQVKNLSKRSQKNVIEILKPLFLRAVREGIIKETPLDQDIKRNAAEEKRVVLGAEEKFKLVHQAILTIFANDIKIKTAFLFGFNGRRLNEVLTLQWSDINLSDKTYILHREKNKSKNDMIFGLTDELTKSLQILFKQKDSEWIFSSNRDPSIHMTKLQPYYEKIRTATGIGEFTFHWMRNLFVSTLVGKEGIDVSDLSALLGHKDTGTLKKYLSLQREQSSKKAAYAIDSILG